MRLSRLLGRCAALAGVAALGIGVSHAQSISPDFLGVVDNGNGTFTYQYNILLDNNTELVDGKQFVIFDFNGLVGTPTFTDNAALVGTYVVSLQGSGPVPSGSAQLGPDDPSAANIVLTYTGVGAGPGPSNNTGSSQLLGRLDAVSLFPLSAGNFTAFAANSQNADNDTNAGNQSFTRGPNVFIPEPGTIALFGAALLPLAGAIRRRKA